MCCELKQTVFLLVAHSYSFVLCFLLHNADTQMTSTAKNLHKHTLSADADHELPPGHHQASLAEAPIGLVNTSAAVL